MWGPGGDPTATHTRKHQVWHRAVHWTSHQLNVNREPHHPPRPPPSWTLPQLTLAQIPGGCTAPTPLVEVGTPAPPATATRLFGSRNTGPPGGATSARLARPADRILRKRNCSWRLSLPHPKESGACGARAACRCPINAHSVQDEDDALSQELLEAWLSPLWSSAHRHPAQNHWKPSAEAQHPSLGQVLSVQMCLGRLCVRARVHVCGQPGPCSASPAATHAQWVWQLCWHQRLEAVGFLPQTSPRPQPCPSHWTLGQPGATRLLSKAGRSTPPGPHPQILGCHEPLPAPCLALNDPAAQPVRLAPDSTKGQDR